MAFSDNAIGFYLEIEDSTFSSTLARAEKTYASYVKALERYNERAFKSASGAFSKLEQMIEAVTELPTTAASSARRANAAIAKAIKPITAKVGLEFTVTSERKLSKLIGTAVVDALSSAKLRLTQGRRMRTPPDIVGRLDLPHFEEGGIVKGRDKAFDSVMAMLKPGEMVLPTEITKQLQEMAGQLRGRGGRFTKAEGLTETLAEIENLSTGLQRLRKALEAGIADPKDVETYNQGLRALETRIASLDEETSNLAYSTKVRLAPAIIQAREQLDQFQVEGEEASSTFERFFKKILGPARFLALNKALSDLSETWSGIREAGRGVFDTLGGDEIRPAIDNLNRMNSFLGLSRDRLREVKDAAFETAAEMDAAVSVDQLTASMANLAEQGVRDIAVITRLAKITSMAAEGMDIAAETANKFGFEMTQSLEMTDEQFAGVFANISQLSSQFNVSGQQLTEETVANVETMGAALRQMSVEEAETVIDSFNRIGSTLHSQFIENAPEIREMLARAFEGGPENVDAMQKAFLLTGKTVDELRETLRTGEVTGLFDAIGERAKGLSTDQLRALSEQVGISTSDLQRLGDGVAEVNANLALSQDILVENGAAMEVLSERATNNKTQFQQWATSIGNTVSNFSLFGFKVGEILDLTKEFNLAQLLSIGYLGKLGIEALSAGGKLLRGLGGIGGAAGKLTGTVTAATGGVGMGGAVAGIFTGISTGLTTLAGGVGTLGAVLLSPPGIAFTVTFVATLLSLGAALKMSAPAIEVWGDVAIAALGGVVDMFGLFMPVLDTFVQTAGVVLVSVLDNARAGFQSLMEVDPAHLFAIGPGLGSIAAGVTALAGAMTLLGAVQIGSAVLSLFTGDAAEGPTGFLDQLLNSITNLSVTAPEQIQKLTATVNNLSGFVLAYARLSETVRKLPTEGFLGGLFGGEDAASKITKQAGPLLDALEQVMSRTAGLQGFSQTPRVAPVAPGAIQQVVQAELGSEPPEPLGDKLDALVALMTRLVGLQEAQGTAPKPEPSAAALRTPRARSRFASDLAGGDY